MAGARVCVKDVVDGRAAVARTREACVGTAASALLYILMVSQVCWLMIVMTLGGVR